MVTKTTNFFSNVSLCVAAFMEYLLRNTKHIPIIKYSDNYYNNKYKLFLWGSWVVPINIFIVDKYL